jgi:hypothetical protein
MSNDIVDPGEGHSPAAWTAVIVMLAAFAIGTAAFVLAIVWLVWASAVLVFVGWGLGFLLAKMGYGVKGPKFTPKPHHY